MFLGFQFGAFLLHPFWMEVKVYIPLPTQTNTKHCICRNTVKTLFEYSDALSSPTPY